VATDLRGVNSIFLYRSFLTLTVKTYRNWSIIIINWSTFAEVILKIEVAHFFETRCIWNGLTNWVVSSDTANYFKTRLDK